MPLRDRRSWGAWLSVVFWTALGATVFAAGWQMDRLAHQGISPWSAPGLLPAVVGALMLAFALVLGVQTWRQGSTRASPDPAAEPAEPAESTDDATDSWRASALAAALCVLFAGVTLGRGAPFRLEAAIFVFVFIAAFSVRRWRAEGRLGRGVAQAASVALAAALGVAWLFESVFLVRLP